MRHPVYVEDLKLLKKPKVIQREIESFKNVLTEDTKVTYLKLYRTILILQVDVEEEVLQKELIKIININRLRTYATEKCHSVSMEFRQVTDEMDIIALKFPTEMMASFSRKLIKLFLSFGNITQLSFLEHFPNVKIFYITNN